MSNLPQAPADQAMYDRSAKYYLQGRLDYSPALIRHATKAAKLDQNSTVLDIGCGPGNLANAFASHAGTVIGVDPSAEMLQVARAGAPHNVSYIEGTLDDVDLPAKSVTMATFGRSFHWTDRARVLDRLDQLIAPGGCVALFYANPVEKSGGPHDWYEAVIRRLNALSQNKNEDTKPFDVGFVRQEFVLMDSPFSVLQDRNFFRYSKWTMRKLMSFALSRYKASQGNLEEQELEVRRAIKRGVRPYGPGPWYTLNQHRVLIASRPK